MDAKNKNRIHVPREQYYRYEKYLPPGWRFTDTALADQGIENLKFKNLAVVPADYDFGVFDPPYYKGIWEDASNVCADCPPTETQRLWARRYCVDLVHYQHWFPNAKETYEQMVGDELYGGING